MIEGGNGNIKGCIFCAIIYSSNVHPFLAFSYIFLYMCFISFCFLIATFVSDVEISVRNVRNF